MENELTEKYGSLLGIKDEVSKGQTKLGSIAACPFAMDNNNLGGMWEPTFNISC